MKKKKINLSRVVSALIVIAVLLLKAYDIYQTAILPVLNEQQQTENAGGNTDGDNPDISQISENPEINQGEQGIMTVRFIDVGNADCSLVQMPDGTNVLIDAGNNADGKDVVEYLRKIGVKKIDYLVGTHPHEDHIGGLDDVINSFEIGEIYMPRIADEFVPSTKTYISVLEAIQNKGLKINSPSAGQVIYKKDGITAKFLNSSDDIEPTKNMNKYSLVLRVEYGEGSFVFMGDAEKENERFIIKTMEKEDIDADVIKVGHHGSRTASSEEWISAVSPDYAYIPCEEGNTYGHPHKEAMAVLNRHNITIYRADMDGTVIMQVDSGKEPEVTGTEMTGSMPLGSDGWNISMASD